MNSYRVFYAVIAAASLAACATPDPNQSASQASAPREKVYTTGSRIPVRDDSSDVQSITNKQDIKNTVPAQGGGAPKGYGG